MALRLIPMMGYEVCVERMPRRRWKSAFLCSNMRLYSSDFTVWVQCFFKRPHALCGESVVKKECARSMRGVVGGHAISAICGRRWW